MGELKILFLFQENLLILKANVNTNMFEVIGIENKEDFFHNLEINIKTLATDTCLSTAVPGEVSKVSQKNRYFTYSQITLVLILIVVIFIISTLVI